MKSLLACTGSLLAVVAGCVEAPEDSRSEDVVDTGTAAQPLINTATLNPGTSTITPVEIGAGYSRYRITGYMPDIDTGAMLPADDEVIVVESIEGVNAAPLGTVTKTALTSALNAEPADTIFVLSKKQLATLESSKPDTKGWATYGGCADSDRTYQRGVDASKPFSHTIVDNSGAFTGTGAFTGSVGAGLAAGVTLRVKRWDSIFGCIPYGVSFRRIELAGYAQASATVALNASFNRSWSFSRNLIAPTIASFNFFVGPVPVHLGFDVPIDVGLDSAVTGSLALNMSATARADFSAYCTSSDCGTTRSASLQFTNNQPPTGSVGATASVTPWVQASVRAYLYTPSLVNAKVGVRPKLTNDLWVYAGNTCGDANGDGTNEYVKALTLDSRYAIDLNASISALGETLWSSSWPVLAPKPVFFADLMPGGSTALNPIFFETKAPFNNDDTRAPGYPRYYKVGMRPCWPHNANVNYRFNWGDGSPLQSSTFRIGVQTVSHTYPTSAMYYPGVTAVSDQAGRTINRVMRIIQVPIWL